MAAELLEIGQDVRWRGRRWRVAEEERAGFLTLVGIDDVSRDQTVHPLVALESGAIEPDRLPLPLLDVASSERGRWRAVRKRHLFE